MAREEAYTMQPRDTDLSGQILERKYRLVKKRGSGGGGEVYEAFDLRLGKRWAVKRLPAAEREYGAYSERSAEAEIRVLRQAEHRGLPRIVDFFRIGEDAYIVMDYVEGVTLEEWIESRGVPRQEEGVRIAGELARILHHLHTLPVPVVYRDMKPSNVMVQGDGQVKLVDFGTAKAFKEEGRSMRRVENGPGCAGLGGEKEFAAGTPGFAAPEQFGDSRGRERCRTDFRADLYALGATLYYLFTGVKPDVRENREPSVRRIRPELSGGIDRIVERCMAKDRDRRYGSAAELIKDLDRYQFLERRDAFAERAREGAVCLLFICSLLLSARGLAEGYACGAGKLAAYWDAPGHTIGRMVSEVKEKMEIAQEWKESLIQNNTPLYELELEYSLLLGRGYESFAEKSAKKREEYYRRAAVCYENILKLAKSRDKEIRASACYRLAEIYERLGEKEQAAYYGQKGERELWESEDSL